MGLLITVEGGEYVGKTSVAVPGLKLLLEKAGVEVLTSREPGGTAAGEEMRQLIFQKHKDGAPPEELALLFNKARKVHLESTVIPFLGKKKEKHTIVILDRYLDSTRIYQGLLEKVPMEHIHALEKEYVQNYLPDLTFILYFPETLFAKTFLNRKHKTEESGERHANTWDEEKLATHLKRQQLYLQLPEVAEKWHEKRSFASINASQRPIDVVSEMGKELYPILVSQGFIKKSNYSLDAFLSPVTSENKSSFPFFL
ncbi:MAG: dTMP kinase [bacterium]|nr:dTMP kinase [bacterium]